MRSRFQGPPAPHRAASMSPAAARIRADLQEALALHQRGRLAEAEQGYRNVLKIAPDQFDAIRLLGFALLQRGNLAEGEAMLARALKINPNDTAVLNNRGVALKDLGRLDEALASFERAAALKRDFFDAFNNRGIVLSDLKRFAEALASYESAIALKPNDAGALSNKGHTLRELERFDGALASYDAAIGCQQDHAAAFYGRGNVLREMKRFEEALASYDKAIALGFADPAVFNNRGIVLRELKRLPEALASYETACARRPDDADAFNNRGNALLELRRLGEALACFDKAIGLKPSHAEAHNGRGRVLKDMRRFDEAQASYEQALALRPDYAEAYYNLGSAFMEQGRWAEAVQHYERVLAIAPDHVEARFALCLAQLPVLYAREDEIAERRAAYRDHLDRLCADVDRSGDRDWTRAIGFSQPFFLAYQGRDDRDLQSAYGVLVCRIMAARYPTPALSAPPRSNEPVRIGIVSGFFRQHSNWKIPIGGWLKNLDRRRFRLYGYHTGLVTDDQTRQASALCERFVQGPLSIDAWRQAIIVDAPHVLIYPEVGMDPVAAQLAAQRLAPVQCNSWGHPDTSGFPTLDYYLSSDLMEPPDGQAHYTERLVRLPNLSIHYEPAAPEPVALRREDFSFRPTAVVYWCGQSLFKYLPQFDAVFSRIAERVGDCQFAFIQYPSGSHVTSLFRQRLDTAFAAMGLRAADHCVFLPQLDARRFVAAIGLCDVVLDSIGWSGCNSTLEGLHYDLPIATMAAPLMRGRHSVAILKMMGVEETITETVDDYVSVAVRLAQDTSWRAALKKRMSDNKHRVYRDIACITALEEFLDGAARREAGG